jgi:hypothetical protein
MSSVIPKDALNQLKQQTEQIKKLRDKKRHLEAEMKSLEVELAKTTKELQEAEDTFDPFPWFDNSPDSKKAPAKDKESTVPSKRTNSMSFFSYSSSSGQEQTRKRPARLELKLTESSKKPSLSVNPVQAAATGHGGSSSSRSDPKQIPMTWIAAGSGASGMFWEVGDLILIKNGIYKICSPETILFQRFSKHTAKGVSFSYIQIDGTDLIRRAIQVDDLRVLRINGWNLKVCVCSKTGQEFLQFEKI